MGKNKKFSPPQRPVPQARIAPQMSRMFAAATQAAAILEVPAPAWNESAVLLLMDALPDVQRTAINGFMEEFASLGSRLQVACKLNDEALGNFDLHRDELEAGIQRQRDALESAQGDSTKATNAANDLLFSAQAETADLASRRGAVETLQRELIQRETHLIYQEQALKAGMLVEREAALSSLRAHIQELERRRDQLPMEVELERRALIATARTDAQQIRQEALGVADQIRMEHVAIETRAIDFDRRERLLRMNEELLRVRRAALQQDVLAELKTQKDALESRATRDATQLTECHQEIDRLQLELNSLLEFKKMAGGNPAQWREESQKLRRQMTAQDDELDDLRRRLADENPQELRVQRDDARRRLDELEGRHAALESRRMDWERSVVERQDWERTKLVMEKSREILHAETQKLQKQVNDLVAREQAGTIFAELAKMDRNLTVRAHTDKLPVLANLAIELKSRIAHANSKTLLSFRDEEIQLFIGGLAMSHLHIFQGISGTGKTSLATAFAKAVGAEITLVAVQAGWRDRTDMLGHFNSFEKKFYEQKTLTAMYRAQSKEFEDRLHVVLLDEMNLSRPEQYFADFLSALEMEGDGRYISLMDSAPEDGMPKNLRNGREIRLPTNLWFIGTANQDETTNAFADKTHDRAFVLDLPRREDDAPPIAQPERHTHWSVSSLHGLFDTACKKHLAHVTEQMRKINRSSLTKILADEFETGWGNRLERQMKRFVPVVVEAGGSESEALDHLLQSRIFREGKVIGRHDVGRNELEQVKDGLQELWVELELKGQPMRSLRMLERDLKRLERGG